MVRPAFTLCLALLIACGEGVTATDAGRSPDVSFNDDAAAAADIGGRVDASPAMDAGVADSGMSPPVDGGVADIGVSPPDDGGVSPPDDGGVTPPVDSGIVDTGPGVMDAGAVIDAGRPDSGQPFCDSTLAHLEHCVTFDNLASGMVVDHSMYARNGTVSPALMTTTAGYVGNGLASTGTGEAYFGNVIAAPASLTIEAWVNFNRPVDRYEALVDKWTFTSSTGLGPRPGVRATGYWLGSGDPGTRMEFFINNSNAASGDLSGRTGWVHVAGTWDSATNLMLLYIDGQVSGQGRAREALMPNTNALRYANGIDTETSGLDGNMDQVRIWSTVRTQVEICRGIGRTPGPNGTCPP
jgi:hypothetical protein